ncbi:MAG TPA: hypothetical protein VH083_18975 [Myxococcales bacterium]|jgi:hypothetical protein|nr:hypothetical protein [Myxococcales bacterium]
MSYRIQVYPEAGTLLRTLAPHLVLRLGQALAELAEAISFGDDPDTEVLHIDDCALQFVVDHVDRLIRVTHIEQREALVPVAASAPAAIYA